MPYAKRRTYKKNKRRSTRTHPRYRQLANGPMPPSKVVTLKYVEYIQINPSASSAVSHIFRANSLFDPDFTGVGGHKPKGTDQMNLFFDHYTVIRSKINAKFISASSSSSTGTAVCGIMLKDNTGALTTPQDIMETANSGFKIMTNSSANGIMTATRTFNAKKFFGLQDVRDNRDLIGSAFTTNPVEDAYFHVYCAPVNLTNDPNPVDVIISMEFTALCTERKAIPQS